MNSTHSPDDGGVLVVENDSDRAAVFSLRYHVYVEELGRYGAVADHENRQLSEPVDGVSTVFLARQDGNAAATLRITWGGEASFPGRQLLYYQLKSFLTTVGADRIAVVERIMVAPALRGSGMLLRLFEEAARFANERRIALMFCDCEPHLLNAYMALGFRTFEAANINSPDSGYLIPLVLVVEDHDYLERIGSPLGEVLEDFGDKAVIPAVPGDNPTVLSERISGIGPLWQEVYASISQLEAQRLSLFDGLTDEQTKAFFTRSNLIEASAGDRIIKAGGVSRNIYVLLEGMAEVRNGSQVAAVLMPGDVFGEMAFLLDAPRSRDVVAAADGTRVVSLSERTIREMISVDPAASALLMLNMAKMLSRRLAQA